MILWPLPWLPDREPFRPLGFGPYPDLMFEAVRFIAKRKWAIQQKAEMARMDELSTRIQNILESLK